MKNTEKKAPSKASSLKTQLAFRFLKAMKKLIKSSPSPSMADQRSRHAIRAAAFASMASTVGPRKAWSRAITRKIRNHKLMKAKKDIHQQRAMVIGGNPRSEPGLRQELNDLSEVVPGGEAMDSCRLLEETGHYIKCLRAQVEIMRMILDYSSR